VDSDRVLATVSERVLRPGERIDDVRVWPDSVMFSNDAYAYTAQPAPWRVASEAWAGETVLVLADRGFVGNFVVNYGFVFPADGGDAIFLNDVATMSGLGRRVGVDLDPIAYAELLAVLYSGRTIDGPVVYPFSATEFWPSGVLVGDPDAFAGEFPFLDRSLVAGPVVRDEPHGVTIEFFSCRYYLLEVSSAVDVLRWQVTGGRGRPATWSRQYVAERVERPLPN
jgi:hypothetical protein